MRSRKSEDEARWFREGYTTAIRALIRELEKRLEMVDPEDKNDC